jgi:hypothetical protein
MVRRKFASAVSVLAATVLALALAAGSARAKDTKTVNVNMDILSATSLGGKSVKPGNYRVIADGSTVTLKDGNKVVAEAPAEWKDAANKASYSSVVLDSNGIKEIHFEGQSRYVEVKETE